MPKNLIKHLTLGEVCAFETDTVVGVGCSAFLPNREPNFQGVNQIYSIKRRDPSKKLPWLISSINMLSTYIENIPEEAQGLLKQGWPDKTSLIFKVNSKVPNAFTHNNTIAFRVPSNKTLKSIIEKVGYPIITTSANFSGEGPYSTIEQVPKSFLSLVDYWCHVRFFTAANSAPHASKIIDCTSPNLKSLRN